MRRTLIRILLYMCHDAIATNLKVSFSKMKTLPSRESTSCCKRNVKVKPHIYINKQTSLSTHLDQLVVLAQPDLYPRALRRLAGGSCLTQPSYCHAGEPQLCLKPLTCKKKSMLFYTLILNFCGV